MPTNAPTTAYIANYLGRWSNTVTVSSAPSAVPDGGSTLLLLGAALTAVVGVRRKLRA